jgi:ParB-like chromosome segregation protein Spo0J
MPPLTAWPRRLASSGFKIPMLVRSSGEIVDGHLRLRAAEKLGIREVPVILCDEWTDAQVRRSGSCSTDP